MTLRKLTPVRKPPLLHYERLLLLIDAWVGLSLRARLILAGICTLIALAGLVASGELWLGPLAGGAIILLPAAFGAWRN
jgi:hypothetical protein